jgi:protein phosphatase
MTDLKSRSGIMTELPAIQSPVASHIARTFRPFSSLVRIDVSGLSHVGLLRTNNEDQFYISKMSRALETMSTSLADGEIPARAEEVNYAMVVADGMGGHAAGEVASRMAISMLVSLVLELPNWFLKVDDDAEHEMEKRARSIVRKVGAVMFKEGHDHAELRGMGSTLTIARSLGRDLLIIHVGDSRAYLLRDGKLNRLTKDHTYAQMLVDCGRLEACDVADSGVRHILTNALGGSTEGVDVDVDLLQLEDGDRLMLCSDGLTDLVDDEAITKAMLAKPASKDACGQLVQMALDAGGRDNVTVVVAAYRFPEQSES